MNGPYSEMGPVQVLEMGLVPILQKHKFTSATDQMALNYTEELYSAWSPTSAAAKKGRLAVISGRRDQYISRTPNRRLHGL